MDMKVKYLMVILLAAGLLAGCSDDEAVDLGGGKVRTGKYTEVWTVNIEPEYVLGADWWGGYSTVHPVMEATDEAGNRTATFGMHQIEGFDFEEGYRYQLKIEAKDVLTPLEKQGIYVADASQYEFTLKEIVSKEYVGIREEGRRDLEMDVQLSRVRSTQEEDSWEYGCLVGTVVGTDEIPMLPYEILMLPYEIFAENGNWKPWLLSEVGEDGVENYYRMRIKVSITPSDTPVYRNLYRRIRLQEIVSVVEPVDNDSIIYMDRDEIEDLFI